MGRGVHLARRSNRGRVGRWVCEPASNGDLCRSLAAGARQETRATPEGVDRWENESGCDRRRQGRHTVPRSPVLDSYRRVAGRSVCFDPVGERRCGAPTRSTERWGDSSACVTDTARPLGGGCRERDLRPPGTPHTPVRASSGELGEDRSGTDRTTAGVGALGPAHGELYPFR